MQVAYAEIMNWVSMSHWIKAAGIQMVVKVPRHLAGLAPTDFQLFCYPEFAKDRQQLEPHTLDYSHVITNIRMHICQHGYEFCKTEHFLHLCEKRPNILSKSIVEDKADPQNVFMAVGFFSPAVQMFMIENAYTETANFIEIMRNWFCACNDHGIRADECVEHWYNMHNYLTQDIEFNKFPSPFSHCYIKGMQIQTFEALLQICSVRIYLYTAAVDDTYNSRAIITIPSESYFSDVKHIDKDGKGYTKGPAVNKLVRKSATVNALKHTATK